MSSLSSLSSLSSSETNTPSYLQLCKNKFILELASHPPEICQKFLKIHDSYLTLDGGIFHYWLIWEATRQGNPRLVSWLAHKLSLVEQPSGNFFADLSSLQLFYPITGWYPIVIQENSLVTESIYLLETLVDGAKCAIKVSGSK